MAERAGVSLTDYGNIGGNAYDKYNSANPVARWLMSGFFVAFDSLVEMVRPRRAVEIGCGEGHLSVRLLDRGIETEGFDVEPDIVAEANALSRSHGHGDRFSVRCIYDLRRGEIAADLIVCCEVLEHLPDPERAMDVLLAQPASHLILSVPREPLWRALNLARGKYVGAFGNTPGHIQHWSQGSFRRLLTRRFDVVALRTPLPWTMALCRPKAH